jgi:glycosyltransferase involved in cell wall biosynthesis
MLTGDLKQSALAMADVYVSPSYSEGFSMSILEGMAAGLPCVITTTCNFPEAATAQAALVVPPAKETLSTALIELLRKPEEAKKMGERANSLVAENYTWQIVAYRLIKEYELVVKNNSSKMFVSTTS